MHYYRQLRAFWICLAALAIGIQMITIVRLGGVERATNAISCCAALFVALYALGCGATLYANEHEEGTFVFLRNLPVRPLSLLAGKLTTALLSTIILALTLVAVTLLFTGGRMPGQLSDDNWNVVSVGMLPMETIAWGLLCSLLIRRPLAAAILAAAGVSLAFQLAVGLRGGPGIDYFTLAPYVDALSWRVVIVTTVLVADLALALRWLRARSAMA